MTSKAASFVSRGRKPARDKLPDTIDPIDIAMIAAASGKEGPVAAEVRALLEKQARLIDTQEILARADLRHRGWQIISERVSALLKGLTALAGCALLLGFGLFLWSAHRASGIVVDAFSVPPALERGGMTGAVVAGQLLDKMASLEAATLSARSPSSFENSWSDVDGVEVPYAGVSLGQLRREARAWLGTESHLKGEVTQMPGGDLAIAFRVGSSSGRVQGRPEELEQLQEKAALQIFKATQPYRYSVYVGRNGGRIDEANAVLSQLARSADLKERLWALHGLALNAPRLEETMALYRRVLRLKPDFLPAVGNMAFYPYQMGHDEEALLKLRSSAAAYRRGQSDYNQEAATGYGLGQEAIVADLTGDLRHAAELRRESLEYGADAANNALRPFELALSLAALHDLKAAYAALAAAGMMDPARRADLEIKFGPFPTGRLLYAIATNDSDAEAADYRGQLAKLESAARRSQDGIELIKPPLAVALARSGRAEEAETALAGMPDDNDPALRARALAAAFAGKRGESDTLFARAVARTPSLPAGHLMWAEALLARGAWASAAKQARLASGKGPRWAEPLKLWGDALLVGRQPRKAVAKYAAAAERAPRWGKLHLKWANALWMSGQRKEAVAKLREAAGMDLSTNDRQLLSTMWNNARDRLAHKA